MPPWLASRWERDTRYYELHLRQDLFGDWVLTRVWGGKGMVEHWGRMPPGRTIPSARRARRGHH